jgi:hypothetical protein
MGHHLSLLPDGGDLEQGVRVRDIDLAIRDQAGRMIVVVDDETARTRATLTMAAEIVTPRAISAQPPTDGA